MLRRLIDGGDVSCRIRGGLADVTVSRALPCGDIQPTGVVRANSAIDIGGVWSGAKPSIIDERSKRDLALPVED